MSPVVLPSEKHEAPCPKSKAHARENLEWYIHSLTRESNPQKRLRGWRIITDMLSSAMPREPIAGTAKDGNIVVDRTHHMRTIETQQNGNNDLFELRRVFGEQDRMFVEFISEACEYCSFTVPSPEAFRTLNSVIQKINDWASDQVKGPLEAPSAIYIVPRFRLAIPCAKSDKSPNHGIGETELFTSWQRVLERNEYPYSVDIILQGERPNLPWACMVLQKEPNVNSKKPRIQFDDAALKDRFRGILGSYPLLLKARQAYKALVTSHILARSNGSPNEGRRRRLLMHALSFCEGFQMLQMCRVWELNGPQFDYIGGAADGGLSTVDCESESTLDVALG